MKKVVSILLTLVLALGIFHTFDSLSLFGTIYENTDYLLDKVWHLNN